MVMDKYEIGGKVIFQWFCAYFQNFSILPKNVVSSLLILIPSPVKQQSFSQENSKALKYTFPSHLIIFPITNRGPV